MRAKNLCIKYRSVSATTVENERSEQPALKEEHRSTAESLYKHIKEHISKNRVGHMSCWLQCIGMSFDFLSSKVVDADGGDGKWHFQYEVENQWTDINTRMDFELETIRDTPGTAVVTSIQMTDLASKQVLWRIEAISDDHKSNWVRLFIGYEQIVNLYNIHIQHYKTYREEFLYLMDAFRKSTNADHTNVRSEPELRRAAFQNKYGHDFTMMKETESMGEFRHDGRFWPQQILEVYWNEEDIYERHIANPQDIYIPFIQVVEKNHNDHTDPIKKSFVPDRETVPWTLNLMESTEWIIDRSRITLNKFIGPNYGHDIHRCYGIHFVLEQFARKMENGDDPTEKTSPFRLSLKAGADVEGLKRRHAKWQSEHEIKYGALNFSAYQEEKSIENMVCRMLDSLNDLMIYARF